MEFILIVVSIILFFLGIIIGRRMRVRPAGDLVFDHAGPGDSIPYMAIAENIETIRQSQYIVLRVRHIGDSQK